MTETDFALQQRNQLLAEGLIKQLRRRNIDAQYCETAAQARAAALALIAEGETVSWGGSVTLAECGLLAAVKETAQAGRIQVIDRDSAATPEERFQRMRQALLADTYLTSFNAVSEDGQLVNVDSVGNRTAAIAFGPRQVIAVVGLNKVVKTVEEAVSRARNFAAPANQLRCQQDPQLKGAPGSVRTPCLKSGTCSDCRQPGCICSQIVITRMSKIAGRLQVILVGETLGY